MIKKSLAKLLNRILGKNSSFIISHLAFLICHLLAVAAFSTTEVLPQEYFFFFTPGFSQVITRRRFG